MPETKKNTQVKAPQKPTAFTPPPRPFVPQFKKPSFNVPKFNTAFRTQNRGGGGK